MATKGRHRRVRSATGEVLEDQVMGEGMILGTSMQSYMDVASNKWGTLRGFFDKKKMYKSSRNEIYIAANEGDDKALSKLLETATPEEINFVKSNSGNTPLHKAAQNGHNVCAFLLVFACANVNSVNKDGEVCYIFIFFLLKILSH